LLFIICYLLFILAACSEPSAKEPGVGYFTINLNTSENTRAVYPPTNTSDLRLVAKFRNTSSGAVKTYTSDGNGSIQGKIDLGNYIVTMDVSLISDESSYARGIAYDNPIEIGSGQNHIKAYVYDVNNAAPPIISAKPKGRQYSFGDTEPALVVSASSNDSGVISYQWYSNATNSNSGSKAISGATSHSYMPPTATEGITWYYVVVTNTSIGRPTTINTVPISIIVNSVTGGGPGSADDPFLVNDVTTLKKVGSGADGWSLDKHYKQTADIDLSSVSNWTPIYAIIWKDNGGQIVPFSGSYDGNGKTISNLTINTPTEDNQGLFGIIDSGAVVKNVGLVNCAIVGDQGVGGVVGFSSGKVENCYVSGTISGYIGVGGVVGINYYHGTNTVQNCYATGSVSGDYGVGGVVGANHGMVQNCYITGTGSVSGNGAIGGVVGANLGVVENCYSTVNVFGHGDSSSHFTDNGVGGVVGNCSGSIYEARRTIVRNCYATGNVSGIYISGGVVGFSGEAGIAGVYATIENCYATGDVYGKSHVGGVMGENLGPMLNCVALNRNITITDTDIGRVLGYLDTINGIPKLANNYGRDDMKKNDGSPAWTNIGSDNLDGASITSSNWGNQSWWTTASNWDTAGWDFINVWAWGSNNLPILRNMPNTSTQNPAVNP